MGETQRLVSPARVFARPTADKIWLGPSQQAALSQLSRPARVRLLVGPPSSGKTTLFKHLTARLGVEGAAVLQCRGPKDTAAGALTSLLNSADLGSLELSEDDQRNLLTVFIQQRHSQDRRVLVAIDDAHTLKGGAWEEFVRLLTFRPDALLVGPVALKHRIDWLASGYEPEEVSIHELGAPAANDIAEYLEWRLQQFDMSHLITGMAAQMIARLSGGRYSTVDVLCQMSLLLLRQLRAERVDARVVRQAVVALGSRQDSRLAPAIAIQDEPANAPLAGHLLITRDGKVLARAPLGQRTLIGRGEHNDVCLASPHLSRHHAVIVGTPDGYYVMDLNSTNGIGLNGQPVERAVLSNQDVLSVGPFRLKVQIREGAAETAAPPETDSLADTAVMVPPHAHTASGIHRIK